MSYDLIKEGLLKIHSVDSWFSALIKYNHKARPYEYTCYELNFHSNNLLKNTISDMCGCFLSIIKKFENTIQQYDGTSPKNVVDKLPISHALIQVPWDALIQSLNVADDTTPLKNIKPNAFIFVGTYKDDNGDDRNIYFISRNNPIRVYKKDSSRILASRNNKILEIEEPLLQFGRAFNAVVYNGVLYTINNNFESIFNIEYSHRVICKNSLEIIESMDIISDFKTYNTFALSGHQPRKFSTFDQNIINNIKKEHSLKILTDDLNIPYNPATGKFDLSEPKYADLFTKVICGKIKHDMFNIEVCEVPNSTPLNPS